MSEAQVLNPPAWRWGALARNWLAITQLALVLLVVHLYQIEGEPLRKVVTLAFAGFVMSMVLPLAYRLRFFTILSVVGIVWVLGPVDGAWLIALGLALIGVCQLPISTGWRFLALAVVGSALAVLRAGIGETPWSGAVWPILGSMFMFRTVLYVRAVGAGQAEKGWTGALAYFFMLPNVAFPLFPVVDYQTFRRTYFDREDTAIYEQGLLWIARGLLHLVLYRFVYYNVLNDPADVVQLSDLVRYMLGTFLLYLKVSGQFHLIVGLLHLFGFRLPETHKLYYLAHSFTELWRRINIYWTEFMMKVVFYPTFFKVKKLGPAAGVGIATAAVFVTTWILHSYQWFWLRGGFPLTAPDILFWGILGALVVRGALKELKGAKAPKRAAGWNLQAGLKAATTFFAFCFLWSLWSAESVGQWVWTLRAATSVDALGVVLVVVAFATILLLGGKDWEAPKAPASPWGELLRKPPTRTIVPLLLLALIAQPAVQGLAPEKVGATFASLQSTGLNAQDAARRHRGYYEQLDVRGSLNAPVQEMEAARADWDEAADIGIIRERDDMVRRDLYPSVNVTWNGKAFSTNSWGMRDREYSLVAPPGTLRIALLGPSHVMGNGVADAETFEAVLEERLNREFRHPQFQRFEILNFGVDGYAVPQQLALLQERVLQFSPDIVIFTQYHRGRVMTDRYLQRLVWGKARITDPEMLQLLERAGLTNVPQGDVPVPFDSGRAVARWFGIDPRMPHGESDARVRSISEQVIDWSIMRIASTAQAAGAQPILLALNAVIDDVPPQIPNRDAIEKSGVPVIDLFDAFPADQRQALRVAPWDEHPNAAGHRLIADRLYPQLIPYLSRTAPRTASAAATGSPENETTQESN